LPVYDEFWRKISEAERLTIDDFAEYLKLANKKLYHMAREGTIPATKLGNQWRFNRDEIDAFMKTLRVMNKDRNGK